MNRAKILLRAEETDRKLRRAERLTGDPLYREANKAIMALLGVVEAHAAQMTLFD